MGPFRIAMIAALGCALALPSTAQTLYKLIDKNGKVTYSETPPKNFDGKVIRMDIDPNANTAVLPKPAATGAAATESRSRDTETGRPASSSPSRVAEERVERAKEKVERAKAALQSLKDNPSEFDVSRVGKAGGGSRPVFSEDYLARIAQAEAEVKAAEEDLARLESGR